MKVEEIVSFYSAFAETYDSEVFTLGDYVAFRKVPMWIVDELRKPAKILDLGCGTGLSSLSFFQQGWEVTGVDLTPAMIEKAKKLPFAALHCQNLESPLPFSDQTFDAVQLLGVMEFIQNPSGLFSEIARLINPDGLFGLTIPHKLTPAQEAIVGIHSYTSEEVEPFFAEARFVVIKQEQFPGFLCKGEEVTYTGYLLASPKR